MNKVLEGLNKEQVQAVTHKDGPLLIIAGAGTGKTRVITQRIAWLIDQGLAKTDEILALTFTDKAAKEMQERVDVLMPYGYTDIWISTFHAFGDRILRENSLIAGLNPDFKVLAQPEAAVFFREHLFEFTLDYYRPLAEPTRFIEALISFFSRAKDEDISASEYLKYAQDFLIQVKVAPQDKANEELAIQQMEVAVAYLKYQELLNKEGLVDFGSQFYLSLDLLRAHPLILQNYRKQFKYILVDEFQDTNFAQFQMVKLLTNNEKNITVVADDDQCIYRWRGAAYSNVLNFTQEYAQARNITLIQNYRSTQAILDSAYQLIQYNNPERFEVKAKINKHLIGLTKGGLPPKHLHFDLHSAEADAVGKIIQDKVNTDKFKFRDFAILVRSNSDAGSFIQSLNMLNIPWQFSGNQGLYAREEVKLCINFLRVIANPSDSLSLYYLVSSEIYKVNLADLALCNHFAKRRNRALYAVFSDLGKIPELAQLLDQTKDKITQVLMEIEKFLQISRDETTGRLLYSFLTDTGYLKDLTHQPTLEKEVKIQNIAKFFNQVRDFELVARQDRVIYFIQHLNLLIDSGDDPPTVEADLDQDAVNILTIHKAKGLEFRVVFLVSLVQGKFPLPKRAQQIGLPDCLIKEVLPTGDFHVQEERRLFYVGLTRAKEELYLTSADDYGGKRLRKVSQFVLEALGQQLEAAQKKKTSGLESIQRFAPVTELPRSVLPKISEDKLLTLSYYQIDDYLTCPLKYKYVNILRVPIMEHHTVIYGRAMHEAVSQYLLRKLNGEKLILDELLDCFEANFDPQGFLDANHQEERFRIGREALARFYKDEEKRGSVPKFIEKEFSFVIGNNKINGRFDRIDVQPEGAVIMDFKTSAINTQKDADKRVKENKQLALYALAYQHIFGVLPVAVELYFLESGIIGRHELTAEDLDDVQEDILVVSAGIRQQEYPAQPEYKACTYCAYSQICPQAVIR
jgi:DNA helicase II / ATP-dependent DNA helicase PcrA